MGASGKVPKGVQNTWIHLLFARVRTRPDIAHCTVEQSPFNGELHWVLGKEATETRRPRCERLATAVPSRWRDPFTDIVAKPRLPALKRLKKLRTKLWCALYLDMNAWSAVVVLIQRRRLELLNF